jgi:outer membrane receptor for ferrienterochelin and colicins
VLRASGRRVTTWGPAPLCVALAALAVTRAPARAQTAAINGTVVDAETGAWLGGATILLPGTPFSTTTDARGEFTIERLAAGGYTLQVVAIGYAADSLSGIQLAEGERRAVSVALHRIPLTLQDIVVTASRAAEKGDESTVSVAALPISDIIRRNVTTIDQALMYVPGVTFNGRDQLDIRGAAGMSRGVGSRVLMLLDGHPILSGDGGEIDVNSIPLLDLDRTEIVKGAYSAVYGSNALGGVVNLITKPVGDAPETVFRARGEAYDFPSQYEWADGRQDAVGLGVLHSRRLGSVGARLYLGYDNTDGFAENGESRRWLGRLKLAASPTDRHPWDLYALVTRERAGESFVWRSADEPYRVPTDVVGDYTVYYEGLTGATVTPVARGATLLRLSPYFNVNTITNYFHDNDDWHTAIKPGLLAQLSWYGGRGHALTFGLDGARTWVRSNFLGQPKILDLAAFAQDEFRLSPILKTSLGVRLDHHNVDVGRPEWTVSPKVGAALRVASRATLRASVGAGYRAPSAIEQFVSSVQFGFQVVPNPALRGEHAWSGEIGTTVTVLNQVRVDAALFGSVYRDLIGPGPAPGQPFVFQFQNFARARIAGADVGLDAQVIPRKLEVQGTYLFLDTRDRDTGEPLPYRSRHNFTSTITVFEGLAGLDLRFRSRVGAVLAYPLDPRSDVTVVDLRFGYRVLGMLWQLKVANLFNQFYVDVQERKAGAPRSVALTAVHGL